MKKAQKAYRAFVQISEQLEHLRRTVENTRDERLWGHEAVVRKRLKALAEMRGFGFKGFDSVYSGYLSLLDEISARLLEGYNRRKGTSFKLEEIVRSDREGYVSSGIISVLVTSHIPKLVAREFARRFPENPKDEYPEARRIKRKVFLHLGDTNTGKTHQAIARLKLAPSGVYLAPLRVLALENFERLNAEGVPCSLVTGEEEIVVEGACHVCSTVEKLDLERRFDVAVIDEIQMIADMQRGFAWTRAVLGLSCREMHVCGAASARQLLVKILGDCGDEFELIEYRRTSPLEVVSEPLSLRDVERGDALIAFSKRRVLELSRALREMGIRSSVIYGDLPPEVRRMQYRDFLSGKSRVLVATDAVGMGVNLPIRRIIFTELRKFDGDEVRPVSPAEVKQIAGRAGRKGIYDVGYVGAACFGERYLRESLSVPDAPLSFAVVGPSEAILEVHGLPLREKLALWSTCREKLPYYRKMDVRDYLVVLDSVKSYRLPEAVEFQLMRLPFDVHDPELLKCFLSYVEERFVKKRPAVSRPAPPDRTLAGLERYYRMVGLYYSFSKNFALPLNEDWVASERERVSVQINRLLSKL